MPDGNAGRFVRPPRSAQASEAVGLHPRLGCVVGFDASGRVLVEFDGCSAVPASTLGPVPRAELEQAVGERRSVVLAFLDGRADAPVLLSLHPPSPPPTAEPLEREDEAFEEEEEEEQPETQLEVDGERREIEASRELTLRCGKASITLRSDGSVTIRGRDVTSWARRRQRIRGGSVSIN